MLLQLRALLSFVMLALGGCSSTSSGKWGAQATLTPGWDRVKQAAEDAAYDPHIWLPLLGAAVFSLGDLDRQTAQWASEHTPLFGSKQGAQDASDALRTAARVNYLLSASLTPSGSGQEGLRNKSKALALGLTASKLTSEITSQLKDAADRKRPGGVSDELRNRDSFPSSHASASALASALAVKNIAQLPVTAKTRQRWQYLSYSLAALTSWARVEGESHYPADVLAGYALGQFIGSFINDAFISSQAQQPFRLSTSMTPSGTLLLRLDYVW